MQQDLKNRGKRANRLFGQLAAEKKKMAIALCLIGLMAFMWVRVLGKKGPQGAEAAVVSEQTNTVQPAAQLKISLVELPRIKGRHDTLARDFFTVGNWRDFVSNEERGRSNDGEVSVISKDGFEESVNSVVGNLKLEVIETGRVPRAFINGKLLTIGDRLAVSDGIKRYEYEVLRIDKTTVWLRCGKAEVQLKIVQTTEAGSQ